MADYDRRGNGGGYNNRKRRYRDDDNNDYRAQQRRRHDVPVPLRIRRQLLSLAESPLRKWHDDAVVLARLVADNDDDGPVREGFVTLACQLVCEQPLKTPFVAGVLLAVNALKPAVVREVLRHVAAATERAMAAGLWRDVKLQLRLLACLQTCLEGDGLFPLLDTLFARAVDLQTASSDDVVGTELVKIILLTIPYIMAAAGPAGTAAQQQQLQQLALDLMEKTDVIASEPHALQKLMDPYHHHGGGIAAEAADVSAPVPAESFVALLQRQLQAEAAAGWPLRCLPRPWKLPPLEADAELQAKLSAEEGATKHALPAMAVPETVVAGPRPLFPEVYFSVYGAASIPAAATSDVPLSVPPVTDVAASLIRDSLLDTINGLDFNRNVTARFLIDVDCYFADNTFVKRSTPFDRLREIRDSGGGGGGGGEKTSTWKPEDVAVDAVFSQLLQLPAPEHKLVYYHAVLAETCKIAPAAIAPSLGRAIRYLYRHSDRMDLELFGRFLDWFAHHLSNFGFTWKWAEWVDDVALPDRHPHKAFIRGAIDKEIRLSFAQRIKNTLPEPYKALISADTEQETPPFPYARPDNEADDEAVAFAAQGRELAALLKRKAPDEDLQAVVERIHSEALDSGRGDPLVASTDVFTTAVLWVGAKSLSHVLACIERTKDRLLDAGAASEAARTQILAAVMAFWAAHPGVALCIVEKLLNYSILTPKTVVQWALGGAAATAAHDQEKGARLAQAHIIELVFNTVAKVTRRVRQVMAASRAAKAAATAAVDAAARAGQEEASRAEAAAAAVADASALDVDDGTAPEEKAAEEKAAQAAAVAAAESAVAAAQTEAEAARAAEAAEIRAMRDLFRQLEALLQPWVAGTGTAGGQDGEEDADRMNEDDQAAVLALTDTTTTQSWAVRWLRVVQRWSAMEESFLAEAHKGASEEEEDGEAGGEPNGTNGAAV